MRRHALFVLAALLVFCGCERPSSADVTGKSLEPLVHGGAMTTLADSISGTRHRMDALLFALQSYEAGKGQPPTGVRDAYWRATKIDPDSIAIYDAWRTEFRLSITADSVQLLAAGADRRFNTLDDIRQSVARMP